MGEARQATGALTGDNLGGVNLGGVNLGGVNMGTTNLGAPNLGGVNLGAPNLGAPNLGGTNLGGPNLGATNLGATNLGATNLGGVNLGGVNLGGVNLGATNLGGVNLGAPNLGGVNLGATNLGGVNLSTPNIGLNIHGQTANGMLPTGEDLWSNTSSRCVVLGLGSSAFARLVAQNTGAKMYAAIKQLPWGFSTTAGGPVTQTAWETLVWGSHTYCSFVLMVPPGATFPGVAGFIKAVWRWTAPQDKSIDVGQIGGGQPIATYGGMMNAGSKLLGGIVAEKAFVAGELAFISATTNNVTVNVDFASWIQTTDNRGLILGDVSGAPLYTDGAFGAEELGDGTVRIVLRDNYNRHAPSAAWSVSAKATLWSLGLSARPNPKRCSGALALNAPALIATKCDAYVSGLPEGTGGVSSFSWGVAGGSNPAFNPWMSMESTTAKPYPEFTYTYTAPVVSETYVHLNDQPYDNPEWLARTGKTCRDVSASGYDGITMYCVEGGATANGAVYKWRASPLGWTKLGTTSGVRIAVNSTSLNPWMVTSTNDVYWYDNITNKWTKKASNTCKDIGSALGNIYCVAPTSPDGQVKKWNGSSFVTVGTMTGHRIAVSTGTATPYVAKSNGDVYKYENNAWAYVTTGCKDIAVGGSALYCTDSSNNVRRWDRTNSTWTSLGRTATAISAEPANALWTADLTGAVFSYL